MRLATLETPELLLDTDRLRANQEEMRARLAGHGVPLRPHVKTAKSMAVVAGALDGQPGGITVSTLKEAEIFFANGVTDITYAVGIAPNKLAHAADLQRRGAALTLLLDTPEQAAMLAEAGQRYETRLKALIEIDVDGHRAGIAWDSEALLDIARRLDESPHTELAGLLTHAGGSYACTGTEEIAAIAEKERAETVAAGERLRAAGLACPTVSVGSTPTITFAERLDGVTEARVGVYMFQDLVMAGLGVCGLDAIALSVLATVIGHREARGELVIDAGWMALSRDRGTAGQAVDQGYGVVCDAAGAPLAEDVIVTGANQEHGIAARRDGAALDRARFPVGTQLRVLPNHACATAACFDGYQGIDESGRLTGRWERFNGW